MSTYTTHMAGSGALMRTDDGLRFLNAPTDGRSYTNAQLDDYAGLRRADFRWRPPLTLTVRARFSQPAGQLRGTAGFGFWNDPFLMTERRLPTLPRALWFFYASPPSDMALATGVPGYGWKAATIDALTPRAVSLAPLAPLALLGMQLRHFRARLWPLLQRRLGIAEAPVTADMTEWHTYVIEWHRDSVCFAVDGQAVLRTECAPHGPLGLVMWIDNQFMVARPTGRLRHGLLPLAEAQWMDVAEVVIQRGGEGRGATTRMH